MNDLKITKSTTNQEFKKNSFIYEFMSSLRQKINETQTLGSSLYLPYFHVISENKDLTFKPTIFDSNIIMLQNEYRQENENSSFIADFSYLKGYQSKISGNDYSNRNSISHLFSKFDHRSFPPIFTQKINCI